LSKPLTGLIEHDDERCPGSVVNISTGGFFLHLPSIPQHRLAAYGTGDYGEIHYAGRTAHGFGQIVRVETYTKGVGVAFSWGADEVSEGGCTLIADVIAEQVKMRQSGHVTTAAALILLSGHVSSALAPEIYAHLKTIGTGKASLSLRQCESIDSSGIQMLMALRDMGAPVVEANENIHEVMQRFQLLVTAS
jgi:hypothetical protein